MFFSNALFFTRYTNYQENMAHSKEENRVAEITPEEAKAMEFKTTVINMLKMLKENMNKRLMETRKMIHEQNENMNKDRNYIYEKQIEIPELKSRTE